MDKYLLHILITIPLVMLMACSGAKKTGPFNAETEYTKANEELEDKHLEDARQRLENIIRMDTEYEYAPLAQLRLGDSYIKGKEPDLALEEFRRFLETYPRHKYAAYAQYQIGLVYFSLIKGPDRAYGPALNAIEAFTLLNDIYPRNPYRQDSMLKMEQGRLIISEHEMRVGKFYFKRKAYHGALSRLTSLVKDNKNYADHSEVLMMLAVSYKGIGEDARSDEYLELLESLHPKSSHLRKARKHIKKLAER